MSLITVTQTIPSPPVRLPTGSSATLRGYYSQRFLDSNGETPVLAGNGQDGFYYEWGCTVDDDENLVIPEIEIRTTDNGMDVQTSLFTGQLFVQGAPDRVIFGQPQSAGGWIIPASLGSETNWGQLDIFNQGRALFPSNLYTYLTAALTASLIYSILRAEVVQLCDFNVEHNGTRLDLNDLTGRMEVFAGGGSGDEMASQYAGLAGVCTDNDAEVFVQSTGYSNLYGHKEITRIGDALNTQNGTYLEIDDVARAIKLFGLPTSDPGLPRQLWNDGGTVKISI